MKKIEIKSLSREGFAKYGTYMNLLDNQEMQQASIFDSNFFADLVTLDFGHTTLPTISVCDVRKQERNIVSFLEAHQYTSEGLLPLDGDVVIFTGIGVEPFLVANIEAFRVPKGTFVKLNPLTVHGTQFPIDQEEVHIVCMLPGRTFKNDMIGYHLEKDEQAELVWREKDEI